MQRRALDNIDQAIKAHSTERSLEELQAAGKKRVRVVSGRRVMEIIQAVVDEAIGREVGAITERDRDRIVGETKTRFERVLRAQNDLETRAEELRRDLEVADRERRTLRQENTVLEARVQAARERRAPAGPDVLHLRDRVEQSDGSAQRRHDALVDVLDDATRRLAERISSLADRSAAAAEALSDRIEGLGAELGSLSARVAANAERHDAALGDLADGLARGVPATGPADQDAVFQAALDRALDQITRTMQRATAGPIDVSEEATDILLEKLLDDSAGELTTNLDRLEVEEHAAGGVGGSLGRLRALQTAAPTVTTRH